MKSHISQLFSLNCSIKIFIFLFVSILLFSSSYQSKWRFFCSNQINLNICLYIFFKSRLKSANKSLHEHDSSPIRDNCHNGEARLRGRAATHFGQWDKQFTGEHIKRRRIKENEMERYCRESLSSSSSSSYSSQLS